MYSANNNHSDNGEVSVTKAVLQPLPSEDPGKQVFADWIAVGRAYLTRAGFGPALVGDDPPHLHILKAQSGTSDLASLTAEQEDKVGPIEAAKHRMLVEEKALKKASSKLAYESGLREYHNKLAAILDAAMRGSAGLRLKTLLDAHAVASHPGSYDGGAMWRALVKSSEDVTHLDDVLKHDRAMELARDVFLPDGCSANIFMNKVNVLIRDHNPNCVTPREGAVLGRFIIGLLPKCNGHEGRELIRTLLKAKASEPGLDDVAYVILRCAEIVRDSSTSTLTYEQELKAYTATESNRAMVLNYCREQGTTASSLAKLQSSGKDKRPGGKPKSDVKQSGSRLPPGQLCSKGTCNFNHDVRAPGAPCFRDHNYHGFLPARYASSPDQVRRIEADRKANATKHKVV